MNHQLKRTTFSMNRISEYFSEKELNMQIGHKRSAWKLAILKELIDNALDECEKQRIQPRINILIKESYFEVSDNGSGIPASTITKSLDYSIRVSDKQFYISPSRGQLGNAMKTIWAAPLVDSGKALFEIEAQGIFHRIEVSFDKLRQEPIIKHRKETMFIVKPGTRFRIYWKNSSCLLNKHANSLFYNYNAYDLVFAYSVMNPDAFLSINEKEFYPVKTDWKKWNINTPTSPHWYTVETLTDLMIAYEIHDTEVGAQKRTVRNFVSEFKGLSSTQKQKSVTEDLSGTYLKDLLEDANRCKIKALLDRMKSESKEVRPTSLGAVGKENIKSFLLNRFVFDVDSFKYKQVSGFDFDGNPYVVEVAFAKQSRSGNSLQKIFGLNFSPVLSIPIIGLFSSLRILKLEETDPIIILVHITKPNFQLLERGKSHIEITSKLNNDLGNALTTVLKNWTSYKKRQERSKTSVSFQNGYAQSCIREVAFDVMELAYLKASANGKFYANARQIFYAARPLILSRTGAQSIDSQYFTQKILKDYIENKNPDWKVVWDARGHYREPHMNIELGLGGLNVHRFIDQWRQRPNTEIISPRIDYSIGTNGPSNRYSSILFIEKEGFDEILQDAQISERFDIAIMSTKGIPVKAACDLLAAAAEYTRIFVLHDFDKAGFTILNTLNRGTRLAHGVSVIDLGFRIDDVKELEPEPVGGKSKRIRSYLKESGATKSEIDFLVEKCDSKGNWEGKRVELNAMTSDQIISWLEVKLCQYNVKKVIPRKSLLDETYRRAIIAHKIDKRIQSSIIESDRCSEPVPQDLTERVLIYLESHPADPWDLAVWNIAHGALDVDSDIE